jgi:hypothetical protein
MKALWYRTSSLYVWLNDSLIGKVDVVFTSEAASSVHGGGVVQEETTEVSLCCFQCFTSIP